MSGADLRRFVGGPFPNLPVLSAAAAEGDDPRRGLVGGPYANLWPSPSPSPRPDAEREANDLPAAPPVPA